LELGSLLTSASRSGLASQSVTASELESGSLLASALESAWELRWRSGLASGSESERALPLALGSD